MSARTLCPNVETSCEDCIDAYTARYPEVADVVRSFYCHCGCHWVAEYKDSSEWCVGCDAVSYRARLHEMRQATR